jgi:hypothetical protein
VVVVDTADVVPGVDGSCVCAEMSIGSSLLSPPPRQPAEPTHSPALVRSKKRRRFIASIISVK